MRGKKEGNGNELEDSMKKNNEKPRDSSFLPQPYKESNPFGDEIEND